MSEQELTYEQAQAILKDLDWGFPPAFEWLQVFLENMWNTINRWIGNVIDYIGAVINNLWQGFWDWLNYWFGELRDHISNRVGEVWGWIWEKVEWLWHWLEYRVGWIRDRIWERVGHVSSWINELRITVWDWLVMVYDWVKDWVSASVNRVWSWIQESASTIWGWIWPKLQWLWGGISNIWNWITGTLWPKLTDLRWWLETLIPPLKLTSEETRAEVMALPGQIVELVGDPITDTLEKLIKNIGFYLQNFWNYVIQKLGSIWKEFNHWIGPHIIDPIYDSFGWLMARARDYLSTFVDEVVKFLGVIRPVTPTGAFSAAKGFLLLGGAAVAGLAGMTAAGCLVHPFHDWGLKHVSAMIYDVTNYKAITGIFMGVLLGAAIKTPLGYYANDLLRPWLLRDKDLLELWSRGAFEKPERLNNPDLYGGLRALPGGGGAATKSAMMGYYGYPGGYVGLFDELANTRIGYFALAAVAREGVFDENWFWESLSRAGYSETVKTRLIDMYRRQGSGELRTLSVSPVMKRYREGFTDYNQFVQEMRMLGYPDKAIDSYRMVADLEYQTDYYTDLLAVYKDAHYKQLIDTGEYRGLLQGLGIRPERAEAYVDRAEIRLAPKPKPPVKPVVMPLYRRDIGAVRYREALTAFRGRVIDSGELYRRLTELELPPDVAEATLRIEEAKLGLIEPLKEVPEKPLYETEEGRVRVRTLVDAFRKDNIDQGELFSGLLELEMERSLVDALVHYELERKAPPPVKPPPEVPGYKTEAGRFRFQAAQLLYYPARILTREELVDSLVRLETGTDLAEAIADFLDVKWLLKPPPPVEPPEPMYLTPVGKVRHKTLIEAFRKAAISEYDLKSGLVALQMTQELAEAIVLYEGIRMLPKPE